MRLLWEFSASLILRQFYGLTFFPTSISIDLLMVRLMISFSFTLTHLYPMSNPPESIPIQSASFAIWRLVQFLRDPWNDFGRQECTNWHASFKQSYQSHWINNYASRWNSILPLAWCLFSKMSTIVSHGFFSNGTRLKGIIKRMWMKIIEIRSRADSAPSSIPPVLSISSVRETSLLFRDQAERQISALDEDVGMLSISILII